MASILITDDAGNELTIDDLDDMALLSFLNCSRLASHFKMSQQTLALRCCKHYTKEGVETPYQSLVLALKEPVRSKKSK